MSTGSTAALPEAHPRSGLAGPRETTAIPTNARAAARKDSALLNKLHRALSNLGLYCERAAEVGRCLDKEVWDAKAAGRSAPDSLPAEDDLVIGPILDAIVTQCERAQVELIEAGPFVDAAIAQGSRAWSVGLQIELEETKRAAKAVRHAIDTPWGLCERACVSLDKFGPLFEHRQAQIRAVDHLAGGFQQSEPSQGSTPISPTDAQGTAPTNDRPAEPRITPVHAAVLRLLNSRRISQTRDQIWTALEKDHGRDSIGDAVADLDAWKFIQCPPRSRKGASLTDLGRSWVVQYERELGAGVPQPKQARNNPVSKQE